jgi:hypothetical protein
MAHGHASDLRLTLAFSRALMLGSAPRDAERPSSAGGNRRRRRLLTLRWNWLFGNRSRCMACAYSCRHALPKRRSPSDTPLVEDPRIENLRATGVEHSAKHGACDGHLAMDRGRAIAWFRSRATDSECNQARRCA